ncbi:ATP-binding protein [Methylobacterium pseudosasicola]|uniref:Serine/threonine-protein kinase RsbT n=1 Tax=Methylobacterium pseudosasicola TaxID=582667 RepID=A0A1I4LA92_9HYPH|nr:ATP-binding protein [Methylobacterium pseudosasicola]SFL87713.1 serine/threonine-protein kinase RsbT [Methylobacterium pseudosasicola]
MTKSRPPDRPEPDPENSGTGMRAVVEILVQDDILRARQASRTAAAALGFTTVDQTRLATVVSELTRNALTYAGGGECRVLTRLTALERSVVIEVEDSGPGIPDVPEALTRGYSTRQSLGLGLTAVRKLMDDLTIETRPGRTLVRTGMTRRR